MGITKRIMIICKALCVHYNDRAGNIVNNTRHVQVQNTQCDRTCISIEHHIFHYCLHMYIPYNIIYLCIHNTNQTIIQRNVVPLRLHNIWTNYSRESNASNDNTTHTQLLILEHNHKDTLSHYCILQSFIAKHKTSYIII